VAIWVVASKPLNDYYSNMPLIEEIADLLEDEGVGVVGATMFIGDIAATEENGLYMVNDPSPEPGYAKLEEVQDALHKRANYTLTNYHVFFSHNLGMIEDMDRDVQRRKINKLTMRFIFMPPIA